MLQSFFERINIVSIKKRYKFAIRKKIEKDNILLI